MQDTPSELSPMWAHADLAVKMLAALRNPVGERNGAASTEEWQRNAVMTLLVELGWIIPGAPPAYQILADAREFSDELVLTKLVARFFRVLILGGVIVPETPAAMDWLRDYIDGNQRVHGPLGKPMIWPGRLPSICQLLREWGFQPTPTDPQYVSFRPGGKAMPITPDPEAPDPAMVEPVDEHRDAVDAALGKMLDAKVGTPGCMAFDRATVIRAMRAAYHSGRLAADTRDNAPREALLQLRDHQEQADPDGARVTVSRQAIDEVLAFFVGSAA